MKKYVLILLMIISAFALCAQTPYSVINSDRNGFYSKQLSLASTWIGSNLSMVINDQGSLEDNFIFSARILNIAYADSNFVLPIVGNIGLDSRNLFATQSGVNIGIFPYSVLTSRRSFNLIVHGGANYKLIPKTSTEGTSTTQFKFLGGIELALGESLPTTLSVTPFYAMHNSVENTTGIEVTGILPLSGGLGLLANYQKMFKAEFKDLFQLGLIVNSQL